MGLDTIPQAIREKYHIDERGHASAILLRNSPGLFKQDEFESKRFRLGT